MIWLKYGGNGSKKMAESMHCGEIARKAASTLIADTKRLNQHWRELMTLPDKTLRILSFIISTGIGNLLQNQFCIMNFSQKT